MGDDSSLSKIIFYNVVRLIIIFAALGFVFAIARILNMVIGGDLIQEEEIVVVHEFETEEEASKARAAGGRGKKKRQ
jgi:hypothetical protein